jgi:hypothetical protein
VEQFANSCLLSGPRVSLFTPQTKPVIGSKSSFTCQASAGSLPLNILWFKDDKEISDSATIRIRTIEDVSNLIIESISSSHSGNYSCKIANRFGSDSSSIELKVEGESCLVSGVTISSNCVLDIFVGPPTWNEKPENLDIRFGGNGSIKCSANGYPKPKNDWKVLKGCDLLQWKIINFTQVNFSIFRLILGASRFIRHSKTDHKRPINHPKC